MTIITATIIIIIITITTTLMQVIRKNSKSVITQMAKVNILKMNLI